MAPPEQDEIVSRIFREVWVAPPSGATIPPLADLAAMWAKDVVGDSSMADEARRVFAELPRDDTDQVLLTTDLHEWNVLAAEREPWLVVDPKPFVGDPSYDPVQHLLNGMDRLVAEPKATVNRLAALTGVDAHRLQLWTFARCVSEIDGPGVGDEDRDRFRLVAHALAP